MGEGAFIVEARRTYSQQAAATGDSDLDDTVSAFAGAAFFAEGNAEDILLKEGALAEAIAEGNSFIGNNDTAIHEATDPGADGCGNDKHSEQNDEGIM